MSSSYAFMVSLTDFISLKVQSVTLPYHSCSLSLAESLVCFLFLKMLLKELTRPYASLNFGYISNKSSARSFWSSVHLSRLFSICFLHLVRLSPLSLHCQELTVQSGWKGAWAYGHASSPLDVCVFSCMPCAVWQVSPVFS